jgi:hypothetical protein
MANNGLPDIVQANPFAAINQGVQAKNQLAEQAMRIQNQAQNQSDRNAFNKAIGMAATGDRTGGQNFLATSAPGTLPDYQGYVSQLDAGKAQQLQQANQQIFRKVQEISQLPPEQRQPAYQAAKAKLAQDGGDVSWLPDDVDSGLKAAYTHVASFDQILKASGLGTQDSIVVAPGSVLANKSTGAPLFTNPAAPKADQIVSVGVPGGTQQFYNTPSGLKPIAAGGSSAPADPMNALIQQANARVQAGENPDVVQADLLKQAQGSPGVSVGGQGGGLGFTPSKSSSADSFRAATPQELQAAGLPAGSSAQVNTNTGKIDILSKPTALSPDKQADVAAKRQKAEDAKREAAMSAQDSISKIDQLLTMPGFSDLGTAYGDAATGVPYVRTDAKNAKAALDTIRSQSLLGTLTSLKSLSPTGASGFGALSDSEGRILATAAANLETGAQDNKSLKRSLEDIRAKLMRTRDRINGTQVRLPEEESGSAAPSSSGAPSVGHVEGGYRFLGGDPGNHQNWEKL